jgi:ABC-type lipoprotein export system ATPase subunit
LESKFISGHSLYLFTDEPTGALDTINGEVVMKMLKEAKSDRNIEE